MGATHESQTNKKKILSRHQWCHYSNIHLSPQSVVSLLQHSPVPTLMVSLLQHSPVPPLMMSLLQHSPVPPLMVSLLQYSPVPPLMVSLLQHSPTISLHQYKSSVVSLLQHSPTPPSLVSLLQQSFIPPPVVSLFQHLPIPAISGFTTPADLSGQPSVRNLSCYVIASVVSYVSQCRWYRWYIMHKYVNKRDKFVQRGLALHRLMCYSYHYINQTHKGFKRTLIYYDTNTQ